MNAEPEDRSARFFQGLAFVASAACAAAALRFAWKEPVLAAILLSIALAVAGSRWLARRRLVRVLRSGDVMAVLERWARSLERIPHAATMAPLMTATAFAANGWIQQARTALAAAERGPAWEAALEHRLFLDALLLTFEGEPDAALEQASRLARLPLPPDSGPLRRRVLVLREAVAALARAFAHRSTAADAEVLQRASHASPLVFWAMRYGAAVVAIDCGDGALARHLLADAPTWPAESAFRAFHDEIAAHATLAARAG